ncbi:uncharacterized protein A1O9_08369 [Exophiala aquamarina CBS 119918]|uniref:Uncharacterized protein n=1 Tax=Exophiala aquamarina CBS 119918 TaxID=1182545 RepID=A0A072P672_9EURO|nr:uncharacterized protein A1O9_08369 [Exophiala aquamarina CBS 119918]KEF55619.1 hypothetical protein A1O9_08369 [Exophiala aquamarina CBS 119918]
MYVYQAGAVLLGFFSEVEGKAGASQAQWDDSSGNGRSFCNLVGWCHRPTCCKRRASLAAAKRKRNHVKEVAVASMFPGAWVNAEFSYVALAQWVIYVEGVLIGAILAGWKA